MPLKKHRRHMRTHENCFSANEAIDWLHNFLRKSACFGSDVSRQQSIQLLQKFLKAGVFEKISIHSKDSKKDEFKDNSQLYRFTYSSSFSTKRSPLHNLTRIPLSMLNINAKTGASGSNNNNFLSDERSTKTTIPVATEYLPECCFVSRNMSVREIENVWKTLTISRLQHIFGLASLDDILDVKQIDGHIIMHNATRFSKTGVVVLKDKTDDLPHWVISAMKCLINWPRASGSGSCLPNYPGFEADVFRVVKDYFTNIGIPLIPYNFYRLFLHSFKIKSNCDETGSPSNKEIHKKNCDKIEEYSGMVSFPSFEKLIAKLPLKYDQTYTQSEHKTSTPLYQTEESNSIHVDSVPSNKQKQITPSDISSQSYSCDECSKELCYETAFINISPVTRLVVNHSKEIIHCGSHSSLHTLTSQVTSGVETASTISACSHFIPNTNLENCQFVTTEQSIQTAGSANNLFRLSSYRNLSAKNGLCDTPRCASMDNLKQSLRELQQKQKDRCSYASAITTLPRKQASQVSGKSLHESRECGSLRQLKSGQRHNQENIYKESRDFSIQLKTPVFNAHSSRSAITKREISELHSIGINKSMTNSLHPSQQSSSNSSWRTCSNIGVMQSSNNEPENKSVTKSKDGFNSKEFSDILDPQDDKLNMSSGSSQKRVWKTDELFWKKPTFQFACKTVLCSFKTPFYRPPTPIACSKLVNLRVASDKCLINATLPSCPEPEGASTCNNLLDKELECKISEAIQLSLLMIPTSSRRHLHLLLRTLNKMITNDKLNLHPYCSTRDFLLETFSRSVICAKTEVDYNEFEATKLVSFLLDQCEIVFQVPSNLKREVEEQLACMQRGKIKYTLDDSCTLTYCEQVSLQQYEEQKNTLSRQSLVALLENLINNPKISDKEKKRKIKQFKENYPEIYLDRFPTATSEAIMFAKKPKTTFFSRFLSVRL